MITQSALQSFNRMETPFFYYDMDILRATVEKFVSTLDKYGVTAHYAVKANSNDRILKTISGAGIKAECATGNEITLALANGFAADGIFFDGVAKTDKEIITALKAGVELFNCESIQELEVIDAIAGGMGVKAAIAVRVNPDVDAKTHKYITTGTEEDKFGISSWAFDELFATLARCRNLQFTGIHMHAGSQITDMNVYAELCKKASEFEKLFTQRGFDVKLLNLGGGLGVDYEKPLDNWMPDIEGLCRTISQNISLKPGQTIHIEPGRAMVANCAHIISRVVYVKEGLKKKFAILDCGMHTLIRPALYQASHKVENLSCREPLEKYDVVGCVCESSDTFAKGLLGGAPHRGDFFAIHSAGAYGQVMNMRYLQRDLAPAVYSDDIK
ncbi:MAG: diaminopimelate decarboxylase [Bacteroidales bacterium]|nr:diaminopimelate decarboxylase [Bacteroidales bacterium]